MKPIEAKQRGGGGELLCLNRSQHNMMTSEHLKSFPLKLPELSLPRHDLSPIESSTDFVDDCTQSSH